MDGGRAIREFDVTYVSVNRYAQPWYGMHAATWSLFAKAVRKA